MIKYIFYRIYKYKKQHEWGLPSDVGTTRCIHVSSTLGTVFFMNLSALFRFINTTVLTFGSVWVSVLVLFDLYFFWKKRYEKIEKEFDNKNIKNKFLLDVLIVFYLVLSVLVFGYMFKQSPIYNR